MKHNKIKKIQAIGENASWHEFRCGGPILIVRSKAVWLGDVKSRERGGATLRSACREAGLALFVWSGRGCLASPAGAMLFLAAIEIVAESLSQATLPRRLPALSQP
jgi:hypothetical protein